MVIKLIFLAIVLYFVVKTAKSLIKAVRNNGNERAPMEAKVPARSLREDVEDAKFVDIQEISDRR
jgi:hypothetical protein